MGGGSEAGSLALPVWAESNDGFSPTRPAVAANPRKARLFVCIGRAGYAYDIADRHASRYNRRAVDAETAATIASDGAQYRGVSRMKSAAASLDGGGA